MPLDASILSWSYDSKYVSDGSLSKVPTDFETEFCPSILEFAKQSFDCFS